MEKEQFLVYEEPVVKYVLVEVEKGFAASDMGDTGPDDDEW